LNNWLNSSNRKGGDLYSRGRGWDTDGSIVSPLGLHHLGSVLDWDGNVNRSLGQVSRGHSKTSVIGNVLNCLEDSICVDILVSSPHGAVSGLHLLPDGVWIVVAEAVLASLVLCVVLGARHRSHHGNLNLLHHRSHRSHRSYGCHRSDGLGDVGGGDMAVLVGLGVREVGVVNLGSHHGLGNLRYSNILGDIVDWQVTCSNSEAKSICDVINSLSNSVSVHIAVGTADNPVQSLRLLFCLVAAEEAVGVLAGIVLSVVL